MSEAPPRSEATPAQRLLGVALMVIGGLIAGLCGLCTVAVAPYLLAPGPGPDFVQSVLIVLVSGALPTAIGMLLFLIGRKLQNPAAAPLIKRRARPKS